MSNLSARHADEFRRKTADHMISAGRPLTQCRPELGLNSKIVGKWVQDRRSELAGEPDPKAEDRELREARRRIRELEMENAFLKKAAAFFAKEQGQPRATGRCRQRGRTPDQDDGENPRREQVRILLVAGRRLPRRRLVGRARGRVPRAAGAGPQVRLPVREALPARRVLGPEPVQGAQSDARAGDTRPHAQRPKADRGPRPQRPDPVRRDLTGPVPTYKLVGDTTCLRTGEGRLYLSTAIDLNTGVMMGWSLSERMTADIAASAPASAKSHGYVAGNAISRADRGAQHASRLLAEWARANDVRLSCSRTGGCHDAAVAESFFATLKTETHCRRSFPTRDFANHAVIEFIEAYCNRRRPHSTIGYKVPAEAMEEFYERTAPKPEELPMAA